MDSPKILIMLVGPQGSGKTEFYKTFKNALRVSQDDHGRWHKWMFDDAIKRGEPLIIVDKTNPKIKQRKRYLEPAKQAGYHTKIVWFDADKQVCLKRIKERREHPTLKAEKAEEAVSDYFSKLEPPTNKEADEIVRFKNEPKGVLYPRKV